MTAPRLILSTPIVPLAVEGAVRHVAQWLPPAPRPPQARSVVLANVHVVTEASLRPAYREAVLGADLVLPDGMPLVWALNALGENLRDRCYGPSFMEAVLDASQTAGWTHFLYGTTAETLRRLEAVLRARWPRATINGSLSPPFGPLDDATEHRNIELINAAGADVVWVGMGCPKQEMWMHRHRRGLTGRVVVGIGTAFDFISGVKPQAPPWMQDRGLEWAFRLGTEPRRLWKRYLLRNPYFLWKFAVQYWQAGRAKPGEGSHAPD